MKNSRPILVLSRCHLLDPEVRRESNWEPVTV